MVTCILEFMANQCYFTTQAQASRGYVIGVGVVYMCVCV